MKSPAMKMLIAQIPSAICFTGAAAIAVAGAEGWGWFLFIGFLAAVS
jgi:hypothetical protein